MLTYKNYLYFFYFFVELFAETIFGVIFESLTQSQASSDIPSHWSAFSAWRDQHQYLEDGLLSIIIIIIITKLFDPLDSTMSL